MPYSPFNRFSFRRSLRLTLGLFALLFLSPLSANEKSSMDLEVEKNTTSSTGDKSAVLKTITAYCRRLEARLYQWMHALTTPPNVKDGVYYYGCCDNHNGDKYL